MRDVPRATQQLNLNSNKKLGIKFMPFGEYLSYLCNRAKYDKRYVYRWQGMPEMNPKVSLLLIVVFITFLMSLGIVAAIVGQSASTLLNESKDSVRSNAAEVAELAEGLRERAVEQALTTMNGLATTVGTPLKKAFDRTLYGVRLQEMHTAMQIAREVLFHENATVSTIYDRLRTVIQFWRLSVDSVDTSLVEMKAGLLSQATIEGFDAVMVALDDRSVRLTTFACGASCSASLACLSVITTSSSATEVILSTEKNPDGQKSFTAAGKLGSSIGVCLLRKIDNVKSEFLATMRSIVTATNMRTDQALASDVEVESAYRDLSSSTLVPLTQTSVSPILARVNQEFLTSNPNTTASTNIYGNTFTELKDSQSALCSGGYSGVRLIYLPLDFFVVSKRAETYFDNVISDVLPTFFNRSQTGVVPYLVRYANGDYYVVGEATPRDASISPHVVLGLNGLSGSMLALDKFYTPIAAGYSNIPGYDVALLLESPLSTTMTRVRSLISVFVGSVAASLESDRELVVVERRKDGNMSYIVEPRNHDTVIPSIVAECFKRRSGIDGDVGKYFARCEFVDGVHLVVLAMYKKSGAMNLVWETVGIGIGVAVFLTIAALILVRLLTRSVLDHIEKDYVTYKQQIEEEKHQFSELIKDVMPQYISQRIMAGEKLIVDQHPQLTFFFSDIVGFTETSRKLSTVEMVRILGYTFMMEDGVAEFYGVHKIKTIGDAYFAVAGLDDLFEKRAEEADDADGKKKEKKKQKKAEDNQVYRMTSFAVVTQQLLSNNYVHYPERTDCFKQWSNTDLPPCKMLTMRMGIHSGPAIAGVVDVGRSPHFDCFGPSVNLASRMESTAQRGRIQLSTPTWEMLSKIDKTHLFEFEPPKKTLVKGYGTINTYTIRSTTLSVPESLLEKLKVDRAVKRQFFTEQGLQANVMGGGGGTSEGSSQVKSQHSSSMHSDHQQKEGDVAMQEEEDNKSEHTTTTESSNEDEPKETPKVNILSSMGPSSANADTDVAYAAAAFCAAAPTPNSPVAANAG